MTNKLTAELESFRSLWNGGYFEGDPLHPMSKSGYGQLGFISVLHATYLACIKPYVNEKTIALEIGPGRGAWTKTLIAAKQVFALDALSAEHNGFYEYVGRHDHVKYFRVSDFDCTMLPENYFSYMFSFGCLCHVSFTGITRYAENIFPKMQSGAHCFWMIADYAKHNRAVSNLSELSYWRTVVPPSGKYTPINWLFRFASKSRRPRILNPDTDDNPAPGRWYDADTGRTCKMLQSVGYKVVDPDVGTN
ncbi:MAG: hypothetical protein ACXWJB_11035, partial [Limisphaerales bacterium]